MMETLDAPIEFSTPVLLAGGGLVALWAQWFVGCGVQPAFLSFMAIMGMAYFDSAITYGFVAAACSAVMLTENTFPAACPMYKNRNMIGLGFFSLAWVLNNMIGVSYSWTGYVLAPLVLYRMAVMLVTIYVTFPLTFIFEITWRIMPMYHYTEENFFDADGVPEEIVQIRKKAFTALQEHWGKKWAKSKEFSHFLSKHFSDLRFASSNRVFFPFSKFLTEAFDPTTIVEKTDRMDLIDIDGNAMNDVSGSYGVNVCGYNAYKKFMVEGMEMVKDLGCVLGSLHPITKENCEMLRDISGHPEISFHMSGTEAVMCAVRVARYNTGKKLIVLFGGAYHGWWDGVQTTAGNARLAYDVLTVKDMDPAVFTLLCLRGHEIAAVVINPLQSFHLNKPPPSDLVLMSNTRDAGEAEGYGAWLKKLRAACHKAGVMFVLDEVYTGFRLAPGGAQEYFGVKADIVAYGKTLGGGMPIGVVCGPKLLMARTDQLSPLRVNYVVGTFSAHPLSMACMNKFLKWSTSEKGKKEHAALTKRTEKWVDNCNRRMEKENLPLRVASYQSIWTMLYQIPGRYHWLLQYYLRDEGVALSWVGTGRLNFSMDFEDADLEQVTEKMVKACRRMKNDGWWYQPEKDNSLQIKLKLVKEIVTAIATNIPLRLANESNKLWAHLSETATAPSKSKGKKSK